MSITTSPGDHESPESAGASFTGRTRPLFWLMLATGLRTVLSLGIYRFWMKTKLRQYYWSNFRVNDEPFEYSGRPMELLIGFLIAIFFLAIYLFLVNFTLSVFSLAYWQGFEPAIGLSVLAVVPFLPYAQYRAQRYILSRTRWRGIRFGLSPGAWRYAGRYLLWAPAVVLSLGLLWPLADFDLRRFVTNRSWFGDQPMRLEGGGAGLYRGYPWLYLSALALAAGFVALSLAQSPGQARAAFSGGAMQAAPVALAVAASLAYLWYSGFRLRYFLNRTVIGQDVRIVSTLRPARFLGVLLGGWLGTMIVTLGAAVVFSITLALAVAGAAMALGGARMFQDMPPLHADGGIGPEHLPYLWPALLLLAVIYVAVFLIAAACGQLFMTRRVVTLVAETTRLENAGGLNAARQRPEDDEHQAEGFADALDVGAF